MRGPSLRVAALAIDHGRVLMVRQHKGDHVYWLLPGGNVERGERLEDAVVRELSEECGLRARVTGPPIGLVQVISPDGGRTRHLIQLVFRAQLAETAPPVATDPAIDEIAWISPAEFDRIAIHPPIADLLDCWLHDPTCLTEEVRGFIDGGVRWRP